MYVHRPGASIFYQLAGSGARDLFLLPPCQVVTHSRMWKHQIPYLSRYFRLWVGDEGWELDYFLHENPDVKRAPYVFLTDFIGVLPMREDPTSTEFIRCREKNTETMELAAVRTPFLYFPLRHHFEQQLHVARRLDRLGAGVRLDYGRTSPEALGAAMLAHLGRPVHSADVPRDGTDRAARLIAELL